MLKVINAAHKKSKFMRLPWDKCAVVLRDISHHTGHTVFHTGKAVQLNIKGERGETTVLTVTRKPAHMVRVDMRKWVKHPSGEYGVAYRRTAYGWNGAVTALVDMLVMVAAKQNGEK